MHLNIKLTIIASLLFAFFPLQADAQDLQLGLPIQCEPEDGCLIWQYVDQSPDDKYFDYKCSIQSYDGHKGTDFRVTYPAMQKGVPVLASAQGKVLGTRNNMRDVFVDDIGVQAVNGKECGNGLVLDHGNGWHTQYCHLKQGSVMAETGDIIQKGQQIGLVGLSGKTSFPHVHFSVKKNQKVVDPFDPDNEASCKPSSITLWEDRAHPVLAYLERPIVGIGFKGQQISISEVRKGLEKESNGSQQDPVILLYAEIANIHEGDRIQLTIFDPEGKVFQQNISKPFDRKKAVYRTYLGKKRRVAWMKGRYRGVVSVKAKTGEMISTDSAFLQID